MSYNWINGTDGNDILTGTDAADGIYGEKGDDILNGGKGDDIVYGGRGNDILSGGEGADIFRFKKANARAPEERDVITDFDPNSGDLLWLQSWNARTLHYTLEQLGEDTLITINSDSEYFGYDAVNEILLVGVQATDLTTDHYGFNNY